MRKKTKRAAMPKPKILLATPKKPTKARPALEVLLPVEDLEAQHQQQHEVEGGKARRRPHRGTQR